MVTVQTANIVNGKQVSNQQKKPTLHGIHLLKSRLNWWIRQAWSTITFKSTNPDTLASRSLSKNRTHNYLFCIWFDSKKGRKISKAAAIVARLPYLFIQKVSASSEKSVVPVWQILQYFSSNFKRNKGTKKKYEYICELRAKFRKECESRKRLVKLSGAFYLQHEKRDSAKSKWTLNIYSTRRHNISETHPLLFNSPRNGKDWMLLTRTFFPFPSSEIKKGKTSEKKSAQAFDSKPSV